MVEMGLMAHLIIDSLLQTSFKTVSAIIKAHNPSGSLMCKNKHLINAREGGACGFLLCAVFGAHYCVLELNQCSTPRPAEGF